MLTDIFADRYEKRVIWTDISDRETKLLVQCFRIVSEDLVPYWNGVGKAIEGAKRLWKSAHSLLSRELGLEELSARYWYTSQGAPIEFTIDRICRDFVIASPIGNATPDRYIKERLSFIEVMFRMRWEEILEMNATLPQRIKERRLADLLREHEGLRLPGSFEEGMISYAKVATQRFEQATEELNERFRRAGAPLNYHNGFIQIATDGVIEQQIERPFWALVKEPQWKNVDLDMKEAVDRRDGGGRDPALYAAKALESTVKIISDTRSWTRGNERGAVNYVQNLAKKENGPFVTDWERNMLTSLFANIRNPLGHGPGIDEMPALTQEQTDWAIESCMSWVRTLVRRAARFGASRSIEAHT